MTNRKRMPWLVSLSVLAVGSQMLAQPPRPAQSGKPNIVVIMGDDIGMWNIGAYHRGLMAGKTPNLDKLAKEGMLFTDYYAEASCTAGRAAFITGELPIRTGMTTVGQAGAALGLPAEAVTIAAVLKSMGYATGQFGKNHLGDKNEFLPTVHGFDEFYGYLYHLDAMEDPCHPNYPQNLRNVVGPRNLVHSWATDKDDSTVDPRWGKVGKQRIEDDGELCPERMKTIDDEILAHALKFLDKANSDGKPFFLWLNPTRMEDTAQQHLAKLEAGLDGFRTLPRSESVQLFADLMSVPVRGPLSAPLNADLGRPWADIIPDLASIEYDRSLGTRGSSWKSLPAPVQG